jgi:hypothetical protein
LLVLHRPANLKTASCQRAFDIVAKVGSILGRQSVCSGSDVRVIAALNNIGLKWLGPETEREELFILDLSTHATADIVGCLVGRCGHDNFSTAD